MIGTQATRKNRVIKTRFLTAVAAAALVALPGCTTLAQPAQGAALAHPVQTTVPAQRTGSPEDNLPSKSNS